MTLPGHGLALRAAPLDAEVLEVAGVITETRALESRIRNRTEEARERLEEAERHLRAALDADPGRAGARLRLGHVLLERDRAAEAERILRAVPSEAPDPEQRYLALLFLGRACERQGRPGEAGAAYRRALEAWPDAQAARLALARSLEAQSGLDEARALVAASLDDSARGDRRPDPWWSYPFGDPADAQASLSRLWARVLER